MVEIAIRAPNISDEDELGTITLLYENLAIPTNETVALYKLLIYYEQIQTFEMLLTYRMTEINASVEKNKVVSDSHADLLLGRNDDDNIYDLDEIISDAFSYAISINHLHIAFYLLRTYPEDVYGNKILCVKSIINSFKNDDVQVNQVLYLEERLFILEKFMKFIEYKMALEFFDVIHDQITDEPKINFLVYSPNPIKIITMLLNIVINLSSKHQNLQFKAQKVRVTLCDIANAIIDSSSSMNEIQDMLLDKTYSGIEIIDYIELLNIIEVLGNPMVDSIITNMYLGPYERESFLKKNTCFRVFEEQTSDSPTMEALVTKSFKIFEIDGFLHSFKKECSEIKLTEAFKSNQLQSTTFDDGESENDPGHMFQYHVWRKSLDVKLIVNLILILLMAVLLQLYTFLFIRQTGRVASQRATVDTLAADTSTATATLDAAYVLLDTLSDDYWDYQTIVIVLHVLTIGYLLQDLMDMVYIHLRGIFVNTFNLLLLLNTVSTVLFLVWLNRYTVIYMDGIDEFREELRASVVIQRQADSNIFNIKIYSAIPVAIQFLRLILALQVNRTFGPMIKIISSMISDIIIFLILFVFILFIFISSGLMLFAELDEYKDIGTASRTLFASSIGEFAYETYDTLVDVDKHVGYIFVTLYLIVSNIMLLNFLIAILSSTYSKLNQVKNGLYMRRVIQLRQRYNYNTYYSSIVFAPPPFNMLVMFALPFIVFMRNKTFNGVVMVFEYVIIGIVSVVIFLTCSLVMAPFTYLLLLIAKLRHIPKSPIVSKTDVVLRVLDFFVFIFIGLFFILFWVAVDTIKYTINLFSNKIQHIDEYEEGKHNKIHQLMDGSLQKKNNNGAPMNRDDIASQPAFKSKARNKSTNPVKEGLSTTTLKILKACIMMLLEKHQSDITKSKYGAEI
jgi:hypothetical protein